MIIRLAFGLVAILAMQPAARAAVFLGFGFGLPFYGPVYVPPPVYYPPAYYPAPPVYYTPPPAQSYPPGPAVGSAAGGQSCLAGAYVCPMERPVPSGAACYCPGNNGQRIAGRAN